MKMFICGFGRHGKDYAARYLRKWYGLRSNSSSHIAMRHFVSDELVRRGLVYDSEDACYADRVNHRDLWFDIISEYNRDDPTRLARLVFDQNDIYVGIRNIHEFQKAYETHLVDLSVWVDASGRLPPEPTTSNTITLNDCDLVVLNNGTRDQFKAKLRRVFDPIFGATRTK